MLGDKVTMPFKRLNSVAPPAGESLNSKMPLRPALKLASLHVLKWDREGEEGNVVEEVEPRIRGVIKRQRGTWRKKRRLICRDGAGNSGLRNHLQRWQRARREKQSQPKRAGVERGYLPENETESTLVFHVSWRRSLGLKCCSSQERKKRKKENWQRLEWGGCQQFTYMVISQRRLQHEKYRISVIFSHDRGGSIFYYFCERLSGTLNCWVSPVNVWKSLQRADKFQLSTNFWQRYIWLPIKAKPHLVIPFCFDKFSAKSPLELLDKGWNETSSDAQKSCIQLALLCFQRKFWTDKTYITNHCFVISDTYFSIFIYILFIPFAFFIRWGSFQGPAQLGNGGTEPLCHGHPGSCHVCLYDPHPVQVLLQTEVQVSYFR